MAQTTGVKHFVYSTLFSIKRVSNGKYTKCTGFDNKEALAQLAFKELPLVTTISGCALCCTPPLRSHQAY